MRIGKILGLEARLVTTAITDRWIVEEEEEEEARYGFNRFINLLLSRRMAGHCADDRPALESDLFCPRCVFRPICVEYARNEAGDELKFHDNEKVEKT